MKTLLKEPILVIRLSAASTPYRADGRAKMLAAAVTFLLCLCTVGAQGTFERLTVTFDGPPVQRPGTQYGVNYYHESSVWFTPIPGVGDSFVRNGGEILGYPDDGTAYLQAGLGCSLRFGLDDGSSFDPVSVDLAEYSDIVRDPVTVHFVGYRQDGTVVTDDITTAGIFNGIAPVFQTFSFDPGFSDLVRVEIPTIAWSLDNLVVSIPEPGTSTLLAVAAVLLALGLSKRKGQ
jgi:hypothetical protein